jgi:hypothetical protein
MSFVTFVTATLGVLGKMIARELALRPTHGVEAWKGSRMTTNTRAAGSMKIDVSTILNCSAEKAWREVQNSALLLRIVEPLARIVPLRAAPLPDRWEQGRVVQCDCYLFGCVPIGTRTILIESVDHDKYEIQTREHDALISRWDHRISIHSRGPDRALYRDQIEIDAGRLNVAVWAWANWLYRHRQRRWRALAENL